MNASELHGNCLFDPGARLHCLGCLYELVYGRTKTVSLACPGRTATLVREYLCITSFLPRFLSLVSMGTGGLSVYRS